MTRHKRQNQRGEKAQRQGLLAKVHIAKKELAFSDAGYRSILVRNFGVRSAADLEVEELEVLIRHFRSLGWVPRRGPMSKENQVIALRERIEQIAAEIPNGRRRMRGLCRTVCGAEMPDWVSDPEKLLRLLAALTKIKEER